MPPPAQSAHKHWGYCRVSSEEQLQGVSIDSQFRRLLDAGIPEDQILVEVGSATKQRTPELQRLFRLGREGKVASILAIRQDRFQRNRQTAAAMWELIDVHKVAFRFLDQPDIDPADPTSVLQAQILGAFAQFETEQLSQRVKNGLGQNRLMKKHHGRPPDGYIAVDGHLQPCPELWNVYREVIACYLHTGSSTEARRIRYRLTGKAWGISSFARWIQSPVIRGYVVWDARSDSPELMPGQHEALLQPDEWEQVKAIRARNRTNTGSFRYGTPPTIGSGLFRCGACGRKMSYKQRSSRKSAAYKCRAVKDGGCSQGHTNWIAESAVADLIRKMIFVAAEQIAEHATPSELPEPQELIDLRVERAKFEAIKSARAKRQVEDIDAEIQAMVTQLKLDGPKRQEKVRNEILRLSDREALNALTDDELRSVAQRYGLEMTSDDKRIVAGEWTFLAKVFPGFSTTFSFSGDLDSLVLSMENSKGHPGVRLDLPPPPPMPDGWVDGEVP